MSVRAVILSEMQKVAAEKGKIAPLLTDETPLFESGLDSLCFAVLVARLEDQTGADPLSLPGAAFPTTVGQLISMYERVGETATSQEGALSDA